MIQVVGGEQVGANKPGVGGVRNFEQYGQPESASIPPNYKPFGSWGLYIGGNPADGYYTNYYKALSNSVDKQQVGGEQVKPSQVASFSPVLKQASSSPYVGGDYYPFAYSPSELNSGRVPVDQGVQSVPHSSVSVVQPQVYSAPVLPEPSGAYPYVETYATKKLGSSAFAQKEVKEPAAPSKGYQQSRLAYVYSPVASPVGPMAMANSVPSGVQPVQSVQQQQSQVVAYPVPVGSQIVGSQPGVDGAFNPYGIHAFTRYAIKPAVVSSDQSYYYSMPVSQFPAYKQQQVQPSGVQQMTAYQPLSFYGYPLNQLHYSQGSIVPSGVQQHYQVGGSGQPGEGSPVVQHGPVQSSPVEAASEKSESEDKSQVNKVQQSRS